MTQQIFDNVQLGENVVIGEWCQIGVSPKGAGMLKTQGMPLTTIIGKDGIIRSHTVIYAGNVVGSRLQTGHFVLIREQNIIGNNVSIGSYTNIEHHVTIEDDARIHSGVFIPEFCHLKKGCWIGPKVCFTNAKYPRGERVKDELKGATVGENAKIGANVTILPGIIIGKNALVGSGSVVTKNVPENTVVAGNPAHVVKKVSELVYSDGQKVYTLVFD